MARLGERISLLAEPLGQLVAAVLRGVVVREVELEVRDMSVRRDRDHGTKQAERLPKRGDRLREIGCLTAHLREHAAR